MACRRLRTEREFLEAFTERIFPADASGPGARDLGAAEYILALAEQADRGLCELYLDGLRAVGARCAATYRSGFTEMAAAEQDAVISSLASELDAALAAEPGRLPDQAELRFFAVACEHTLQGVLGDPGHGGNRGAGGWRLIGFPGVQWGYLPQHQRPGFDARALPIWTLADLEDARHAFEQPNGPARAPAQRLAGPGQPGPERRRPG